MDDFFKINGQSVGFANHETEGTGFLKGALDSYVTIEVGKLKINLLTPALDLSKYLPVGSPDFYATPISHLRLATYTNLAVPGGKYGSVIECPANTQRPGFEVYGLPGHEKFHGVITVEEGVIRIEGEIRDFDKTLALPISIRKSFKAKPLLPHRKKYSLARAREVAPLQVYNLQVGEGEFTTFPTEILAYKNLEHLWMGGRARLSFSELPEGLFTLAELRVLLIYGHRVKVVPAAIHQLVNLEEFCLESGPLATVPDEIGQLGQLRRLSFRYNELTSLPSSLPGLPALRELNIEGNKFKSLPANLVDVYAVQVDRKFKKLYTDNSYVSNNTEPIDRGLYDLSRYPEARAWLSTQIDEQPDLHPGRAFLQWYARMATFLVLRDDETEIPLGASKVGGGPDLPKGYAHPANAKGELLVFHAQLNCEELAPHQAYLPRTGMLYFFVTDEEMIQQPVVRYVPETASLVRQVYTPDTQFSDADLDGNWRKPSAVAPENGLSLPDLYSVGNHADERFPAFADLWGEGSNERALSREQQNNLQDAVTALAETVPEVPRHQFPYSSRTYHALNCFVFTQHDSPEEQAAARFGGEPQDWLVLLCMESIGEFSFWDAGTLTYCIHKSDLAIADFSKVHASIESS